MTDEQGVTAVAESGFDAALVPQGFHQVRPEAQLLLATARLRMTAPQQAEVREFLAAHGRDLDWGEVLDQAARHGVLPLVSRNLIRLRLTHSAQGRHLAPYRWLYTYVYEGNRRRNLALWDEYAKVLRGLNDAGVEHAVRKGPVICQRVYDGDLGARRMGDLDLLLSRDAFPAFEEVVRGLDYQQGAPSDNGETIVAYDRRTKLFWQVNLSNVALAYVKLARQDDVELFIVDPYFSLFPPSWPVSSDAAEFLGRSLPTTLYGEPTRMLVPVDQIVDACVQLHVEATVLHYIDIGKDLTLSKFLDLAELVRRMPQAATEELAQRAQHLGCEASVYYALHFTAQIHPDAVPADLIDRFRPADVAFLEEYGGFDDQPQRWELSFADRLFDQHARRQKGTSVIPGPRGVV